MARHTQPELFSTQSTASDSASDRTLSLRYWFEQRIGQPSEIQQQAWPILAGGDNALLLAQTGQGKSLAAWLPIVERVIEQPRARNRVLALHIAPLKALARDMTHNLNALMQAASVIAGRTIAMEHRSGDTLDYDRDRQLRKPPVFMATTPETLFILLTSTRGRQLLRHVQAIVIDELHAMAHSKRGAHLALSLERLDQLTRKPVQRIGLSATAKPADSLAAWLSGGRDCKIVQTVANTTAVVQIERLSSPLGPFPHHGHWQQVHERIAELAQSGLSSGAGMLVFCTTRAQVEKTTAALSEWLGEANVGAHHGSLNRKHREQIEQRFRTGDLKIIVSSASLELGIDLGQIDRVCQIGSIGSINRLCQRAGRSGHRPDAQPIVHVFPLTLNQCLEAEAAAGAIQQAAIEVTRLLEQPMDVLVQHIVSIVSARTFKTDQALFDWIRRAHPWRHLTRTAFDSILQQLLSESVSGVDNGKPLLARTQAGHLQADPQAARIVMTNAGTIPEWFQYEVVDASNDQLLGQLDEEFAFESSVGDVIQLGNRPFQIVRTRPGTIQVLAYDGDAAQVPFWFGDGPGRSSELSQRMLNHLNAGQFSSLVSDWLQRIHDVFGALPSSSHLLIERFHDPNNDRHIVLHTFAGARLNRAWGLALRKRFCRQFNFELQAAATDDGILISIGAESMFEVDAIVRFVTSKTARSVLIQALLDTPLFVTRFRWCANTALSVLRVDEQGPVSPQIQRNRTENLIEQVFPDQLACLENLSGPRDVPDHPLVQQALTDCLHEHMDIDGLEAYLQSIETGRVNVIAVDLDEPSPLAESLIHAPPHSFLDEEAAEERRTRSFESRPGSPFSSKPSQPQKILLQPASNASRISVQQGKQVLLRLLDEAGYLTRAEGEAGITFHGQCVAGGWTAAFQALMARHEAFAVSVDSNHCVWVSAKHLPAMQRILPGARIRPWQPAALMASQQPEFSKAMAVMVQARKHVFKHIDSRRVALDLMCSEARIDQLDNLTDTT